MQNIQVSMKLALSRPYQVCLIVIAVLGLYYSAIFAEVSILDDLDAISSLFNIQTFDVGSLFFPRVKDGGYYRPFLGISYMIDRFWWFLDPKIMHFENILMHLVNSLLVFFVGIKLCKRESVLNGLLPLAGALLFALHPINTESINWISGRTDPMACIFVLSALLFVLKFREERRYMFLLTAFILTLCGILSKETAFGFFLGAVFVLAADQDHYREDLDGSKKFSPIVVLCYTATAFLVALLFRNFYMVIIIGILFWLHLTLAGRKPLDSGQYVRNAMNIIYVLLSLAAVIGLFYILRKLAYVSDTSKVTNTLKAMVSDFNYTLELFIGAAGFYVKKFLIPTPLNLAIREIDPLYELFGVVCYMACVLFIYLRRTYTSLIIAGFMMLSPAFLFVFGTFAWTAYAERYCYIPSAFWILAGISYIDAKDMSVASRKFDWLFFAVIAIYFLFSSFQRNLLWLTNITIMKDTVKKSPNFKNARGLYMSALVNKKDFAEAERQYLAAQKIKVIEYDVRYDLVYAEILNNMKRYQDVEKVYQEAVTKTKGGSTALYEAMIAYYDSRIYELKDAQALASFGEKKIAALEKLYGLNRSPFTAYRLGQNYLTSGDPVKAQLAIRTAIDGFKSDEPLKRNAEILLNSIGKN